MSRNVLKLFLISVIFFSCSCAPKRVEMPVYEGADIREFLSSKNSIESIDTVFSITFEKPDAEIRGEGALNISRNGDMVMRVYSFGFLAFEMTSRDGIIRSNPAIDRNKGTILTSGLRDCLFWWDMNDFQVEETEGEFLLRNLTRMLWLEKKTAFPMKQVIALEDGRELNIFYANPEKTGNVWYPSKIRIELSRYAVTLKIRNMSFIPDA